MPDRTALRPVALTLVLALCGPALARDRRNGAGFELGLEGTYYGSADGGPLEVSTTRLGVDLSARVPLAEAWFLLPGIGFERSIYEFDGLSDALPGAGSGPEGLSKLSASLGVRHASSRDLGYFGVLTASVAGESGADLGDALTFGAAGGVRWSPTEEVSLQIGAGVFSRLEDDVLAIPALGFRWTPSPDWTVNVGFPRTRVEYRAAEEIRLFLGGEFDFQDFRLDGDGPLEDGVLRDDAIGMSLGIGWDPSPTATLEISGGATVYRELTFDDASGDELLEERLDSTPILKVSLTFRF
jgi:hypothetical protein